MDIERGDFSSVSYSFFSRHFRLKRTSSGWYVSDCPFCGRAGKGAFNFDYNCYKCWVCSVKTGLHNFLMKTMGFSYSSAVDAIGLPPRRSFVKSPSFYGFAPPPSDVSVRLPEGYRNILEPSPTLPCPAEYLTRRGFDVSVLSDLGFGYVPFCPRGGYGKYSGYIIIPFKRMWRIVYFIGRDYTGTLQRYVNPSLDMCSVGKSYFVWNEDALYLNKKVYICEGVFSALAIGMQAVALMGKKPSEFQINTILDSGVSEAVVVFDSDAYDAGVLLASRLSRLIRAKALRLPHGDPAVVGRDVVFSLEESTEWFSSTGLPHAVDYFQKI